jgi:glyoxylase-like metal-dependent hydrolase (beta-lactamase superfamily II)
VSGTAATYGAAATNGAARIEHLVTSGVFSLDGQDFDVDNNVWLIGDDTEVIVVDAAHEAASILAAVGDRRLTAIVCTHAHNDHINAAAEVAAGTGAEILVHPADRMLWDVVYPDAAPQPLTDGQEITVAGTTLTVLHTPGHSPGAVSLYAPALSVALTGDTLFRGGPGATGRSFSSFPTIIESIRARLLTLPADTRVLTGHGDETSIGAEASDLESWLARGH